MNVIDIINQVLKKAGISKVNLSKYLGVSRQMVYNYLDGDNLSKLPNDKCKLLLDLFGVNSEKELLKLDITSEYIQEVSNRMFDGPGRNSRRNYESKKEIVDISGLSHEEATLVSDIAIMLKNIILEGKSRSEENIATVEYMHNFIQNLNTNKELKYVLGFFSKNFGYTAPSEYAFDENNQFVFESIMFSAITLYSGGGASKKEEKLSRTQELNTAKVQALRELGYDKIDEKNASEVLDKIAEIMSTKI